MGGVARGLPAWPAVARRRMDPLAQENAQRATRSMCYAAPVDGAEHRATRPGRRWRMRRALKWVGATFCALTTGMAIVCLCWASVQTNFNTITLNLIGGSVQCVGIEIDSFLRDFRSGTSQRTFRDHMSGD